MKGSNAFTCSGSWLGGLRAACAGAEIRGKARVIDLSEPTARTMVMSAATVKEVYESDVANDYAA
jgi:hypothetical protein